MQWILEELQNLCRDHVDSYWNGWILPAEIHQTVANVTTALVSTFSMLCLQRTDRTLPPLRLYQKLCLLSLFEDVNMVLSGCIYYPTNNTKQTSVPKRWHSHRLTRRRRAVANEHEKKGGGKQNVFVCAGGGRGHPGDRKNSDIIRFATSRNTAALCVLASSPVPSRAPPEVQSLSPPSP